MENNRNFFITIALSVVILTLWQVFYMNPRIEAQQQALDKANEVDALCACESTACRTQSRARLDDIDSQHGMMTGVAFHRMTQLDQRRRSCEKN